MVIPGQKESSGTPGTPGKDKSCMRDYYSTDLPAHHHLKASLLAAHCCRHISPFIVTSIKSRMGGREKGLSRDPKILNLVLKGGGKRHKGFCSIPTWHRLPR